MSDYFAEIPDHWPSAVREAIAATKRDAARYRWIRAHCWPLTLNIGQPMPMRDQSGRGWLPMPPFETDGEKMRAELDAEIDRRIESEATR